MSDIGMFIKNNCIQLNLDEGDLEGDIGIETAVLISLFTDRRATEDELPPGVDGLRGWWGDLFPSVQGDQIGSKLWTLQREKVTLATLAAVESAATNSLQWMIDDGVASSVEVNAEFDVGNAIILSVNIVRQTGDDANFNIVWDGQELRRG